MWWFIPIIPGTQGAEIGGLIPEQPEQKFREILFQK
jgi:hypothetical protein